MSMAGSWRDSARPRIEKVLNETRGKSEDEIKKALFDAYPWGKRRMWPYKVWCDEIKRQRGLKKSKIFAHPKNQTGLFNGVD